MTQKLLKGFQKFREREYEGAHASMPRLSLEGQNPRYFIISCIDSRTNPGVIFSAEPGSFFAHKAMGAIIRPYKRGTALAAALQFALEHNKVEEIIILGHTGCSAIRALINGINDKDISGFLDVAQRGVANAKRKWISEELPLNLHRHAEEQIVLLSAENITTYPSVAKALKEKRIQITPWLFDMDEGKILSYNPNSEEFEPIEMPSEDKENLE